MQLRLMHGWKVSQNSKKGKMTLDLPKINQLFPSNLAADLQNVSLICCFRILAEDFVWSRFIACVLFVW